MVPAEGTSPAKPLETLDVDTLPPTVNRGTLRRQRFRQTLADTLLRHLPKIRDRR